MLKVWGVGQETWRSGAFGFVKCLQKCCILSRSSFLPLSFCVTVSAVGDTKHAHLVPPWFPSNKKLILSFNTKCLHLFTTYCIIARLEFNSLHSYAVKTISLLLSHIYIQVLLHMPLSRILNTGSLFPPTTTSCISPTFLCKVTSLQKIGVPADFFFFRRKQQKKPSV